MSNYYTPAHVYRLRVLIDLYTQHTKDMKNREVHVFDNFCDFWGIVLGDFELNYDCDRCPCIALSSTYCNYRRINAILK